MTSSDPPESETGTRPEGGSASSSPARAVWEWTKTLAVAILIFLFLRSFVVEAFQIPTASMEDTLLVGDFLLVNKAVYGAEIPGTDWNLPAFDEPERGDVVVFEPPPSAGQAPRTFYVKRVIGIPGDTVSMKDGLLHRNGERVVEPYVKRSPPAGDRHSDRFRWQRSHLVRVAGADESYRPTRDNWGAIEVTPDGYFVMGDNRAASEDSRYWGFVSREAIKGMPMFVYYSFERRKVTALPWIRGIRWERLFRLVR